MYQTLKPLPAIKQMLAVASGKGGVGKSTIAFYLALALKREGATVGLLDADIYGPSQPLMLKTAEQKPIISQKTIQPIENYGLQTMSIGYLIEKNTAMIWRGPMLAKAMEQLIYDTQWKNIDYLVIDLPPGTGDVQLTLCQKLPLTAAVMVTTPQELALADVRRAIGMFTKLNVPVLGIIENMSLYQCSHCGHEAHLFGQGGGEKLSSEFNLPLLGSLPLDPSICQLNDIGNGPEKFEHENLYATTFRDIAVNVARQLASQKKDYRARFPKIVVEHQGKQ